MSSGKENSKYPRWKGFSLAEKSKQKKSSADDGEDEKPPSLRRSFHASASHASGDKILIYGGKSLDDDEILDDLLELDVKNRALEECATKGSHPPPLHHHSAVIVDKKFVLFGGLTAGGRVNNRIFILDIATMEWRKVTSDNDLSPKRYNHSACTAVVDGQYVMIVFGGMRSKKETLSNGLHVFHFEKQSWTSHELPSGPSPRGFHSALMYRHKMFVYGGHTAEGCSDELWTLNMGPNESWSWQMIKNVKGSPAPRRMHSMTRVDRIAYILGGEMPAGKIPPGNIDILNLESLEFSSERRRFGAPPELLNHSATLLNRNESDQLPTIIVTGGCKKQQRDYVYYALMTSPRNISWIDSTTDLLKHKQPLSSSSGDNALSTSAPEIDSAPSSSGSKKKEKKSSKSREKGLTRLFSAVPHRDKDKDKGVGTSSGKSSELHRSVVTQRKAAFASDNEKRRSFTTDDIEASRELAFSTDDEDSGSERNSTIILSSHKRGSGTNPRLQKRLSMANNDLIIARKNIETIIEKGEKKEKVKLKEKELDMLKQHMDKEMSESKRLRQQRDEERDRVDEVTERLTVLSVEKEKNRKLLASLYESSTQIQNDLQILDTMLKGILPEGEDKTAVCSHLSSIVAALSSKTSSIASIVDSMAISDITPIDARSRQVSDAHEEKSTDNNSNNNNTATTSAFRSKSQPTTTIIPPLRASLVEDEKGENSNGSSVLANARRRNKSSPRNKTAESPSSTTGSTSSPRKKNTPSPRKKKDSLPSSALKQKVLDFGKDKDNSNSGSVFAHSDPPHSSLRREKVSVRRPHEELDAEEQSIDPTVDGDDTDEERNTPEGDNLSKAYRPTLPPPSPSLKDAASPATLSATNLNAEEERHRSVRKELNARRSMATPTTERRHLSVDKVPAAPKRSGSFLAASPNLRAARNARFGRSSMGSFRASREQLDAVVSDRRSNIMRQASIQSLAENMSLRQRAESRVSLSNLSDQKMQKYICVMEEMMETEKKYVADMEMVKHCFMKPLEDELKILSEKESRTLFGNLNELIDFQQRFCGEMQRQVSMPVPAQNIGNMFLEQLTGFVVYKAYCANISMSDRLRKNLVKGRKRFLSFLTEMQNDPQCRKETLKSFLIRPLQRLCKYPLLLKELYGCLEYTVDLDELLFPIFNFNYSMSLEKAKYGVVHDDLTRALTRMDSFVSDVNESMLASESQLKVFEVQELFSSPDEEVILVDEFRQLIQQDTFLHIVKKSKGKSKLVKGHFFLFNDILVVGQDKTKGQEKGGKKANSSSSSSSSTGSLLLIAYIPMEHCVVDDVPNPSKEDICTGRLYKHYLQILRTDRDLEWGVSRFMVICQNEEEKQLWYTSIQATIDSASSMTQRGASLSTEESLSCESSIDDTTTKSDNSYLTSAASSSLE